MKYVPVIFLIFLIVSENIYAQTVRYIESISYICPENTNIFSSYTEENAREISREEKKNALYVFSETIDEYFTAQEKNNHLFEGYISRHPGITAQGVAADIQSGAFPLGAMYLMSRSSDTVSFLLNNKKARQYIFSIYVESEKLWDYPRYKLIFISDDKVFTFDFLYCTPPGTLGKGLPSYAVYEENGGMGSDWYWTDKNAPARFYKDMASHNPDLPESVSEFQKNWEKILASIRIEE
ncbi:MAG TPA: hypothetical protein DCL73_12270 [Treponema sp.]|nr:hypothetical protein [Treponema sp.]